MSGTAAESADAIFLALADIEPAERAAALDRWCVGNAPLRAAVEEMLAGLDDPHEEFLDPHRLPTIDPDLLDAPLQPGARLGEFLVLHAIGSGGMGIVYAAQQDRPRRTVAIKVLRRSARRRDVMKRFEREAEMLGRMQDAGIAQVHAFHPGNRHMPAHLVMEFVDGPPVTEFAEAHKLPYMARVTLAAQICDATHHAHERGIVHRDLKPANVLVTAGGQPKILDFGIARASGLDLQLSTIHTQHGQLVGTMAYMSPEQLRAAPEAIDARTDVYALGVLFYRLLSGRLPFAIGDLPVAQAIAKILEGDATPLGLTDADLRGPLEAIIGKAMAREPRDRYQSAAELAADLRAYADGRYVPSAGPRTAPRRRDAPANRDRLPAYVAIGLVVAALLGYLFMQQRRIDRLEREINVLRHATP